MLVKNQPAGGLTTIEACVGLTFDNKHEKMCLHFQQMQAIYGGCGNVDPPMLGALGLSGHLECYYKENDKDYDKEEE